MELYVSRHINALGNVHLFTGQAVTSGNKMCATRDPFLLIEISYSSERMIKQSHVTFTLYTNDT